jgi:pantetheine-phosphate adenylyltransferase
MSKAVFPGSFDPVTLGHIDVIRRNAHLFDEVVVLVAENAAKQPWFPIDLRVKLIQQALDSQLSNFSNVTVDSTDGLVADFCKSHSVNVIIRSLRHGGDYDAEISMALVNRKLANVETIFLPATQDQEHISSSVVKEVAFHGGDISKLVPDFIADAIWDRLSLK